MEDIQNINQPGYRPRFVSEFSMGQLDFLRYNEWLKYIEHWSAEINSTDAPTLEMVQHLFSGLVNIYDSWRPLIATPEIVKKLDEKIKDAKVKKRIWENTSRTGMPINPSLVNELVDILGDVKTKLMDMKQILGLGIVVKRNLTTKERIRIGMGGKKKFKSLPET